MQERHRRAAVHSRMSEGGHLHPGAALLANVVAVHNVQDFIPDGLGIATTAHTTQHVAHPLLSGAACPSMSLCDPTCFSQMHRLPHAFGLWAGPAAAYMDDEHVPPSAIHIVTVTATPFSKTQEYQICSVKRISGERLIAVCIYKYACLSHAGSMQDSYITSKVAAERRAGI